MSTTASSSSAADDGVVIVPLSPLDAIMGGMGLTIIYVFPPPTAGAASYDLKRVHSAFTSTIREDYPLFIGKLHTDPVTGAVAVAQTPETRVDGAEAIRFFTDSSVLTTEEAVRLAPLSLLPDRERDVETVTAKATALKDGGLVLGVNLSHTLLDGEGMFTFYKVWGSHYRGVPKSERLVINHDRHLVGRRGVGFKMPHPEFIQPAQVQPTIPSGVAAKGSEAQQQFPPTTQKPFHLTPVQLKKLKDTVVQGLPSGEYVSTIDVVTALFVVLISQARGHGKGVKITTGVNARTRFSPPLPANYAGNVIFNSLSTYEHEEIAQASVASVQLVARRIRASILRRDEEFLRDAIEFISQDGANWSAMRAGLEFFFGNDLMFTSWANMGMYDADFGAGKSLYTGPPMLPLCDGMVIIMEGINAAGGLDVLPLLKCETMDKLTKLWTTCELLNL